MLELHAFLMRANLPDRDRWQSSIEVFGFPFTLDPNLDLTKDTGFSPSTIEGEMSGFEIYPDEGIEELCSTYPTLVTIVSERDYVLSFRWGTSYLECACVLIAAAALEKDFGAIVYDPQEDRALDIESMLEDARKCLSR